MEDKELYISPLADVVDYPNDGIMTASAGAGGGPIELPDDEW